MFGVVESVHVPCRHPDTTSAEETTQSVLAAQKRLEKSQKKKKKDAADTIVARMGGAINSNFKEVSEIDFDQVHPHLQP